MEYKDKEVTVGFNSLSPTGDSLIVNTFKETMTHETAPLFASFLLNYSPENDPDSKVKDIADHEFLKEKYSIGSFKVS